MFSNLEVGDEINVDILNNSLKNIYLTNYFKVFQHLTKMEL